MKKIILISVGFALISIISNGQYIDWKKTHKLVYNFSFGIGSGNKINTHVQTSFTPGFPGNDEYINGFYFPYSLMTLSYYHFKYITFHINIAPIINKQQIGDVEDMKAKSHLYMNRFKTQINIFHKEDREVLTNIYLGYGIGINSFNFFRKPKNVDTKVTYNSCVGHTITLGIEGLFYDKSAFVGGFAEFNYHIANMELNKVVENGITYSRSNLPSEFEDWKTYNANRWDIQVGMRFSIFNKKLKLTTLSK